MKKIIVSILALVFSSQLLANTPLPTPENIDIARYIGKWYAVAALPQFFTRKCVAQTAEYGILSADSISVLNTCIKKNGKTSDIKGKAVVTDHTTNARLQVTFDSFFTRLFRVKGEYVIIKIDEGYDTVLVGSTNRKSLWILARTPAISPEKYQEYIGTAKSLGFDTSKLVLSKF